MVLSVNNSLKLLKIHYNLLYRVMVNMMYQIYIWDNWWLDPEDPIYKISYPCGGREGVCGCEVMWVCVKALIGSSKIDLIN